MAVRILLIFSVLAILYGCEQTNTAPEQPENKPSGAQQEEERAPPTPDAKTCADFYGPQDAQAYFDTKATAADKQSLNPDGDE